MLLGELLFWCKEWCAAMADKITDFVYADDSKETFDVINVLLLGWILLGLVVYVLGNVIAAHWRRKKGAAPPKRNAATRTADGPTPAAAEDGPPCAAPCPDDVLSKSEEGEGEQDEPLVVEGGELCEWVAEVLEWVRRERVVSPLADAWRDALNASTRIAATEHDLLVDFRDLLPTSRPPKVTAIRQMDGAVECEVELRDTSFELGVWRCGEGGRRLPPLPYVLHLHTLAGKVWVECSPRDVSFVARYLEPPQVELSVEPSNDTQDVAELCALVCRDALCGSCVRLRLACFPECPRPPHLTPPVAEAEGRELLVKVVRAENLGEGVLRPFCVVEVDDPPQRHATPPAEGSDPQFDEHFTLSVKDSAELLFEVYDQEKATSGRGSELVGLCMVEVGELLRHPCQRQVVPLTASKHDAPSATLTLEFVFPEERRVETRVTAQGTLITTTTIQRTNQDGGCVAGRALAQLGASPSGTSRSTLIIHSVHRPESSSPESPRSPSPHHKEEEERSGRDAGRKGGVLGALRRRLSLRSRSSERSSNPASPRRVLGSSTRSSLSEASGVSAVTFVHENSTLVVETNENGIVRRYLIPGGGARMKRSPRGAKLHIFNDHVFVARHLAGSVACCVCGRHLTRRPGKQGYECRGCGVRCHKSCHVRVGDFCPNSSVNAMEVEYLQSASPKSI